MARARFGPALLSFAAVILVLCAVGPAAAQNTIPQTTCGGVNGTSTCLTNGFLQDLQVDCSAAGPGALISTALAQITDRSGPNRIRVSNTCSGFPIVGFNRLTIEGSGAAIIRGMSFLNSRNVTLRSLTVDFTGLTTTLGVAQGSSVVLDGVTVQNASNAGVSVGRDSTLGFSSAPSLITLNGEDGIFVDGGSANVANVTISNNGRRGIRAQNGASVVLSNTARNTTPGPNFGQFVPGPVDISGNGSNSNLGDRAGILLEMATLITNAEGGSALIHIHNNLGGPGVGVFASSAELTGQVQIDANSGDPDFGSSQVLVFDGTLGVGEGALVQGGLGAIFHSSVIFGDGGPLILTGGATFQVGSTGVIFGNGSGGASSIDALTCDGTSWVFNPDNTPLGANTCPTDGPTGIQGPPGPAGATGATGPQGPQGIPGISARQVVSSSSPPRTLGKGARAESLASCPSPKTVVGGGVGIDNPNFVVMQSIPFGAGWDVVVQNNANNTQTGTVNAIAICAIVQ